MKPRTATIPFLFLFVIFADSAFPQETTEELVKRLKGQAGEETSPAAPEIKTRGFTTRGFTTRGITNGGTATTASPQLKTETRSVYFSTRGMMPKALKSAAGEGQVELNKTAAKPADGAGDNAVGVGEHAFEVRYDVDSESKVARDNILFEKGSAEFADEASFQVVSQLATALRDPSLADLKYVIEGHASAEGSAYANQILSQRRSERIVSVLIQLGVDSSKLLPVGFGESQARFPAHSEDFLLKQDRRVLIFRLDD